MTVTTPSSLHDCSQSPLAQRFCTSSFSFGNGHFNKELSVADIIGMTERVELRVVIEIPRNLSDEQVNQLVLSNYSLCGAILGMVRNVNVVRLTADVVAQMQELERQQKKNKAQ